jgi:hypothetical protein
MLPEPSPLLEAVVRMRRECWDDRESPSENLRVLVGSIARAEDAEAMAQLLLWLQNVPDAARRAPVWIRGNWVASWAAVGIRTGYLYLVGGHVVLLAGAGYWRDRPEGFCFMSPAGAIEELNWWKVGSGLSLRVAGQRYSLQFSPYKNFHLTPDGLDFATEEPTLAKLLIATAKVPLGIFAPGTEELTRLAEYPRLSSDAKIAKRTKSLWRKLLADARSGVTHPID